MAALNARRAAHHRPPVRGLRGALRGRPGAPRRARRPVPARARRSSAASTTTRGPRSSSTSPGARASSRRSAAAAATTGSSSCSAAGRRPGIGFGIGLDRVVLALDGDAAGRAGGRAGAGRGRRRGRPGRHGDAPARSPRSCAAAGIAARAELGRRKLGKQLEAAAREGAHFAVILGDELAAGEVQFRDLPAGHAEGRCPLADLAPRGRAGARRAPARGREG